MLKLMISCMLLIPLLNTWWAVQCSLFLLSFLVSLYCFHEFDYFMVGSSMVIDSLSYVLILLKMMMII